jgi:hypothetical protein
MKNLIFVLILALPLTSLAETHPDAVTLGLVGSAAGSKALYVKAKLDADVDLILSKSGDNGELTKAELKKFLSRANIGDKIIIRAESMDAQKLNNGIYTLQMRRDLLKQGGISRIMRVPSEKVITKLDRVSSAAQVVTLVSVLGAIYNYTTGNLSNLSVKSTQRLNNSDRTISGDFSRKDRETPVAKVRQQ